MKKIYFFGLLIVALVLIAGCVKYTNTKSASPEEAIKSMLPNTWEMTIEDNSIPIGWSGESQCKFIKLNNPAEEYYSEFGGFNYTAWHNFWFCPKNWIGECTSMGCDPQSVVQEYPAGLLCNCNEYKIYHLSIGENSQKDLPEKIKNEFSK